MLRDTTSRGLCVRVWPFFAWPPYWTFKFFFYWTKIDKLKAHIRDTDDSEIGHPPESGSRAQTACSGPSRRGAPGPQCAPLAGQGPSRKVRCCRSRPP